MPVILRNAHSGNYVLIGHIHLPGHNEDSSLFIQIWEFMLLTLLGSALKKKLLGKWYEFAVSFFPQYSSHSYCSKQGAILHKCFFSTLWILETRERILLTVSADPFLTPSQSAVEWKQRFRHEAATWFGGLCLGQEQTEQPTVETCKSALTPLCSPLGEGKVQSLELYFGFIILSGI